MASPVSSERRKILNPQWLAPFKGLAFINPEQTVIFLLNISKEPMLWFWKKQMWKGMFDVINEQSQRKSYLSSRSHMRKQFSEQCADSLVFNNSLFFVLHCDLISVPTAGASEHLKGDEPNIEICRSHPKVHSSLRLHFLSSYADYFCKLISLSGPIMKLMRIRALT